MKRRSFLQTASLSSFSLAAADSLGKSKEIARFGICADLHYDLIPDASERLSVFVEAMNQQNADFIVQLGDFCTPKDSNRPLLDIWNRFEKPKYHVIGNHETDGGFTHAQVVAFWKAKGKYYSFDAHDYHFVVLNGNEKNPAGSKGYPRYIGAEQRKWLIRDLAGTKLPVIVFCHQGLDNDVAGIEQAVAIRRIFEKANDAAGHLKVRIVFSGHHHQDYHNHINGVEYVQINSMSYYWAGDKKNTTIYDQAVTDKYAHLSSMLRYREPLWALVTVFSDGRVSISGRASKFLDISPDQAGITEAESIYPVVPVVSDRNFKALRK